MKYKKSNIGITLLFTIAFFIISQLNIYSANYTIYIHSALVTEDTDITDGIGIFCGADAIERALETANANHLVDPDDHVLLDIKGNGVYKVKSPMLPQSKSVIIQSDTGLNPELQLLTEGNIGRILHDLDNNSVAIKKSIKVTAKKTSFDGYFRLGNVIKNGTKKWCFIDPDGNPFYSTGVTQLNGKGDGTGEQTVTKLDSEGNIVYGENGIPETKVIPTYGYIDNIKNDYLTRLNRTDWQQCWFEETSQQLEEWNINTIGHFANLKNDVYYNTATVHDYSKPYIINLDIAKNSYHPLDKDLTDVFSEEFKKEVRDQVHQMVKPNKYDPNLIGYCYVGEYDWSAMGFDHDGLTLRDLFYDYMYRDISQEGKQEIISFLKNYYSRNGGFLKFKMDMGWYIQTQVFPFPVFSSDIYPHLTSFDDIVNYKITDNFEIASANPQEYIMIPPTKIEIENLFPSMAETYQEMLDLRENLLTGDFDAIKPVLPENIYTSYTSLKTTYDAFEGMVDSYLAPYPNIQNLITTIFESNDVDNFVKQLGQLQAELDGPLQDLIDDMADKQQELWNMHQRGIDEFMDVIGRCKRDNLPPPWPFCLTPGFTITFYETYKVLDEQYGSFNNFINHLHTVSGLKAAEQELFSAIDEFERSMRYAAVRKEWARHVAKTYFKTCYTEIKKYDDNHLILGAEFIPWATPTYIAEILGQYTDVVTINHYNVALGVSEQNPVKQAINALSDLFDLVQFNDFDTFHSLTGNKPIMITEFSFISNDNLSGCTNSKTRPIPRASTDEGRIAMASDQIAIYLDTPYIIGYHWFNFMDQPPTGRTVPPDGEDYSTGLVSYYNEVYTGLTNMLKQQNARAHDFTGHNIPITAHDQLNIIGPQ